MPSTPTLATRQLGRNGPQIPRMGLGLAGLSGFYGNRSPESERLQFLTEAFEMGARFWDTADEYNDSEDLLGKWFASHPTARSSVFLATKFGIRKRSAEDAARPEGETLTKSHFVDSSPEYCRVALEKSLRRLGVPFVDLYYVHRLDKKTPIEKTVEAMAALREEGKVKYLGLSECSAESLRRACKVATISCVQVEYSPGTVDIERNELLTTARELGVAIVAYSPLGHGLLTGTLRSKEDFSAPGDLRAVIPWLHDENLPRNFKAVDLISTIAKASGVTPAQVVLAWLFAQGEDIFPIPGTSNATRLKENLESIAIELSPEEERAVRAAGEALVGNRFQEATGYAFADTPLL